MNQLDSVSEHTTMLRDAVWLRHIRYNEEHYGFKESLDFFHYPEWTKAVVLGTSPLFKRFDLKDLRKVMDSRVTTIACDIALPLLAELKTPPDYVVAVDSHPVVANFFRRSQRILSKTIALLSTTIHRDVVEECRKAGARVCWIQGFSKQRKEFYRDNVAQAICGGGVGTTSFTIAATHFRCSPIGLLAIENAWSDETPYFTLQHFNQIAETVGAKPRLAIRGFKRIRNRRDGQTYIADIGYWSYLKMFQQIWDELPTRVCRNTYNLTREGILSARGLKQVTVDAFLKLGYA